jgi:hypothetical protein
MAAAVSYVHLYGFAHKNIRPETILLLHCSLAGDERLYSPIGEILRKDQEDFK